MKQLLDHRWKHMLHMASWQSLTRTFDQAGQQINRPLPPTKLSPRQIHDPVIHTESRDSSCEGGDVILVMTNGNARWLKAWDEPGS